jgi:hypothetical protein
MPLRVFSSRHPECVCIIVCSDRLVRREAARGMGGSWEKEGALLTYHSMPVPVDSDTLIKGETRTHRKRVTCVLLLLRPSEGCPTSSLRIMVGPAAFLSLRPHFASENEGHPLVDGCRGQIPRGTNLIFPPHVLQAVPPKNVMGGERGWKRRAECNFGLGGATSLCRRPRLLLTRGKTSHARPSAWQLQNSECFLVS